jgi:hypothetical protein
MGGTGRGQLGLIYLPGHGPHHAQALGLNRYPPADLSNPLSSSVTKPG